MHPTRTRDALFYRNPIWLLLAVFSFNLASFAEAQANSGPAEFDIISVKLHMTAREVTEVLSTRFGAKIDPLHGINVTKSPGKYNPATPYVSHVQYKTKVSFSPSNLPRSFRYRRSDGKVLIASPT